MARTQKTAPKLLARIPGDVPAKIYRSRITPAAHVKYLDIAALKKANSATIEIGSIKAGGLTVPMIAEIRQGMVVRLRPTDCKNCEPTKGKAASRAVDRKRAAKAALQKVRDLGVKSIALPMPVAKLLSLIITIGPITIIIDWDFCIVIETDTETCFYCVDAGSWCLSKDP